MKHEVRTLESTTRHQMKSETTQEQQPEVFRIEGGSREQRWLNIGNTSKKPKSESVHTTC